MEKAWCGFLSSKVKEHLGLDEDDHGKVEIAFMQVCIEIHASPALRAMLHGTLDCVANADRVWGWV